MISKVIIGKTFYGCCRYVCKDEQRATVLETEGVRDYDYRRMAQDFEMNRQQRPNRKTAVFHGILSFYPGETLPDEKLVTIAREYLQRLKIVNTQYAITKHIDKAHLHLHIVANLVNYEGTVISDSNIGLNGKKSAQALTQKYQLIPADKKEIALTNLQALNEEEATRYEIFLAIDASLPKCSSFDDLQALLLKRGIETRCKYKGNTSELQGISFKKGLYSFKGSSIDRKFSIAGLQKAIQQKQGKQQQIQQTRRPGLRR